MKLHLSNLLTAAALASVIGFAAVASADTSAAPLSRPIPPDRLITSAPGAVSFSGSGLGRVGNFAGTIVNQRCDFDRPPGTKTECDANGQYYALQIDGEQALFTLLPTEPLIQELRSGELTGKPVRVTGIYYPLAGSILVGDVQQRNGG
jgi:hypothetical protein